MEARALWAVYFLLTGAAGFANGSCLFPGLLKASVGTVLDDDKDNVHFSDSGQFLGGASA